MENKDVYLDKESLGIIFVGPSSSGKSTLRDILIQSKINDYRFVQYKPHTSRKRRPNEHEYVFVSDIALDELYSSHKILFKNEYHGNRFVTTWPNKLNDNECYIHIYSPASAAEMKKHFPNYKIILILPDNKLDLRKVILSRDPNITKDELEERLSTIPEEIREGKRIADKVFINEQGIRDSGRKLIAELREYF